MITITITITSGKEGRDDVRVQEMNGRKDGKGREGEMTHPMQDGLPC